jgi:threonine aldolase
MAHTYLFRDDYSEGTHPRILEALSRNNLQQEAGYGDDSFSKETEQLLKKIINKPNANVHFVSTGTQANLICLASILKPYESVIAADTGHPNVHEAGAIEATGHKINTVIGAEGKLVPESILEVLKAHTDEHMVQPKAVYISQATELGTIYSKRELQQLSKTCKQTGLYLYIDGARIGSALMAQNADFDLSTIADICDMFYIGGTKNGALFGEAVVIVNPDLQHNFRFHLKQRGALLAKMRFISVQFLELFKDNLYFENAKHANVMAQELAKGIKECGYSFLNSTSTNQIFPILPNSVIKKLQQQFAFYIWKKDLPTPDSSAVRLCTSWATPQKAVQQFLDALKQLSVSA